MLANHALPPCHLDRMHLVVSCNLSNRLDPAQGFQSYFGLEGACIPFPFSFTHSSAVFSCPAEPEKSNLASGPNFGVHFCPDSTMGTDGRWRRPAPPSPILLLSAADSHWLPSSPSRCSSRIARSGRWSPD